MAAEGEGKNPAGGGGGGGDNPQHQQQAVQAAPVTQGEAAHEAGGLGTGEELEAEKADREGEGGVGAGEKDDSACRDLVLVEDPEVLAVEDPEEGTAPVLAVSLSGHGSSSASCPWLLVLVSQLSDAWIQ